MSESSNGRAVTIARGRVVTVLLHSTYWTVDGSTNAHVLAARGTQQTMPDPPGSCLPGVGCGTVSEQFTATGDGTAQLTASRTTCGEAMACTPQQRRYVVTVHVTG